VKNGSESLYNGSYVAVPADYNMNYSAGTIQPLSSGGLNFNP